MNAIKAIAQIRVKQVVDMVLKNLKMKILGQAADEVLITTDTWYKHYKANVDSIVLRRPTV